MRSVKSGLMGLLSLGAVALSTGAALAGGPDDGRWDRAGYDQNRWSGFYVGGHFGWSWSSVDVRDVNGYQSPLNGDFGYDVDGAFGGLQYGYNIQTGGIVIGVESDLGYLNLNDRQQFPPFVGVRSDRDSVSKLTGGLYGTTTGRLGITFGGALLYGKVGWGMADVKASFTDPDPAGIRLVSGTSKRDTINGLVFGGGLEWAISKTVSIKAEYLRLDFDDTITVTARDSNVVPVTRRFAHDIDAIDTVKVGFNIKLGRERDYVPLK